MKRSHIIKDVANDLVSLETTLTRLKIILSELAKPELTVWVDNELSGYDTNSQYPNYRLLRASGAYAIIDGVELGIYFTNRTVSLDFLLDGRNKEISETYIPTSIRGLENAPEGTHFVRNIPTNLAEKFISGLVHVKSAGIDFGDIKTISHSIASTVKQRALDVLLLLEREFGNLDDFDISLDIKQPSEIDAIINEIFKIIGVREMSITVNNNGGKVQNNFASGNAAINAAQNNGVDIQHLLTLIETVRKETKGVSSSEEQQAVLENLEVVESELSSPTPRKSLLKTAIAGLQAINGTVEFGASVTALIQFAQSLL